MSEFSIGTGLRPDEEDAFVLQDERWIFRYPATDLTASRKAAQACNGFVADDEDEWLDDTELSCVNCARRRWLSDGFACLFRNAG